MVVTGDDGRVQGFQEKPDPAEALSDLANCMIYVLEPEIFDHFPDAEEVDFALDVFPALLDGRRRRSASTSTDDYWNDVGSLPEYLQGNLDVLTGAVDVEPAGELLDSAADAGLDAEVELDGPGAARRGRRASARARASTGPLVVGPGASIGAGARVRESVLLAGRRGPGRRPARRGDRRQRGGACRLPPPPGPTRIDAGPGEGHDRLRSSRLARALGTTRWRLGRCGWAVAALGALVLVGWARRLDRRSSRSTPACRR